MISQVIIKDKILQIPIIQGGMGVGVSLSSLAGHVMREGGMGVISAAHPGYRDKNFAIDSVSCNIKAIHEEIRKAKEIANGKGLCGVNIMVASKHYEAYVKASVDAGADAIISGAGIPMNLPEFVQDSNILLAPIVSSGKVAQLILKAWDRHYHRIPNFIVIEGSKAGGHLGFTLEQLERDTCERNEDILKDVLNVIQPYEKQYGVRIPIFVAGGIFDGKDIGEMLALGASGVQMATRFIATYECDAHPAFKQKFMDANADDIQFVKSPAGLPGRAIRSAFSDRIKHGRQAVKHCVQCIKPCIPSITPYCISEALIQAVSGNVEEGLVFSGVNASRIHKLQHVHELIKELLQELEEYHENSISV